MTAVGDAPPIDRAIDPALVSIEIGDDPGSWADAGFSVVDGGLDLGGIVLRFAGRDQRGIRSWSFEGLDPATTSIDGLAVTPPEPDRALATAPPHPNGAVAIDHVVVASEDAARTTAAFEACGFGVRRVRDTDTYGAPMRQVFFRSGSTVIEMIGPHDPVGDDPAGFFGLALTVSDLDAAVALLGDAIGTPKDAVQPGRRIATVRHRSLHLSVALAFMSPR